MLEFDYSLRATNQQPYVLGATNANPGGEPSLTPRMQPELVERNAFSPLILDGVRELGQPVEIASDTTPRGYWAAIGIDATSRKLQGAVSRGLPSSIEVQR